MAEQLRHGTWVQEDGTEIPITSVMINSALSQVRSRPGCVPDQNSLTLFHVIPSRNVRTRSFQDNVCASRRK